MGVVISTRATQSPKRTGRASAADSGHGDQDADQQQRRAGKQHARAVSRVAT